MCRYVYDLEVLQNICIWTSICKYVYLGMCMTKYVLLCVDCSMCLLGPPGGQS